MRSRRVAEKLLQVRALPDQLQRGAEEADRGLLAGGENVGGHADDVDDLGEIAVRKPRGGQSRQDVVTRLAAAVLDVAAEAVIEPLQRVLGHFGLRAADAAASVLAGEGATEFLVVRLRDAEQIRDDEHGERVGVPRDELGLVAPHELVDLTVGEPPHEILVLLEPLRRELAHQQVPVVVVLRGVHRDDLVAERQLASMFRDEGADILLSLERNREPGERAGDGVAGRERVGVRVDGEGLLVPGHHVHTVYRLAADRALVTQPVEVRIRIGHGLRTAEEVQGVVVEGVGHAVSLRGGGPVTNVAAR